MDYLDSINTGTWLAVGYCIALVILLIAYFWFVIRKGTQNAKDEAALWMTFEDIPTPDVFLAVYSEFYEQWKKEGGKVQFRKL